MTNLKIEAILKPSDEQIKQMIKTNVFDPGTHKPENIRLTVDCDLHETSWQYVFEVLKKIVTQDGFLSAEITKETDND
jgi:predicted oxidoreductase (fatty acid repression mutant protein)